ncbi:multiple monosaccharide ABC transporter permease [Anaerosalibacter sp. Marseille-P3206]|uniref:multiple monosaccharide ABC transporter permease n=1 Tax=Anaerosalibacter sp. Marseille-P3206 TaxID=1871005 RepID=UPI000985CB4A|nr:multiple monosaccharide ABC transporter permease [Anaerosalibacter sp. Marseille-P3206]
MEKLSDKNMKINIRKYAMFIALISITILFQITTGGVLLKPMNVSKLIMQNSYVLILAIGMLPVILTGNIDLSVGSVLAFVSSIAGVMIVTYQLPVWLTIIVALAIGVLVGAWQGFWIAYVRIPSFIVTLAGMLIFRGLTLVILNGNTLAPFPKSYQYLAAGFLTKNPDMIRLVSLIVGVLFSLLVVFIEIRRRKREQRYNIKTTKSNVFILKIIVEIALIMFSLYWLSLYNGVPVVLFLLVLLILIYSYITKKTVIGRGIYAFGGNERASELSGIKTNKVFFLTYVNMGLIAALAGIIFSGRLNAATPSAGNGFELDAIAACYIGGASASGGVGTIIGAVVGGLVMGVLNNGMSIMGIGIDWQQAIKGLVLLAAVAFDTYNQKKKA